MLENENIKREKAKELEVCGKIFKKQNFCKIVIFVL
jgi:hypothetical protein